MTQIPCAEVRDSDFGEFDAATKSMPGEVFEDRQTDRFTPFSRVSHAIGCSRYVEADSMGRVRFSVTTGKMSIADTLTPAEAAALAAELLAAACAAKTAIRGLS